MAKMFLDVNEAMEITGLSQWACYKLIYKVNAKLKEKGYLTISGKCYRKAFLEALGIVEEKERGQEQEKQEN